ncbi:hypothetical protein [Herbiconiux sp. L3-i23]|uniref:hypothetical protein n=1 Tax=Herbiconiux sp. L3-i23 TaxID=2905871 RepID=UPI00206F41A2|nr:hypothetical protein [Herbiconiux sp. L3-i23]BDI21800.1 hypothetical protein L3i23_05760 [Herbiconiux sp. L3-i23]
MHFAGIIPEDMPPPATADEVSRRFGMDLFTFVDQPALEETSVSAAWTSSGAGGDHLDHASLTYMLLRNPDDREDPVNRSTLPQEDRDIIEAPPEFPLPQWFLDARRIMLYRSLWEAVRTAPRGSQSVKDALLDHIWYALVNRFREERVVGEMPGEVSGMPTVAGLVETSVLVDGVELRGVHHDFDPHVYAIAVEVGDRLLTVVVPREELPYLRLEFVTRAVTSR